MYSVSKFQENTPKGYRNIPRHLKVGGHDVKVVFRNLEEDYGFWNMEKNEITIHDNLPQSQVEATLLHEIIHVLNAPLGDSELGHCLLDSLSLQIYQTLKENKLLNMAKNSTGLSKKYPKSLKTKKGKQPGNTKVRQMKAVAMKKGKKVTVKK